jgi:biopolymer transport protein ExbD
MSRLTRHQQEDDEAGIDLTPMLDVVFIMLIFFIVTASFVKESGFAITRPESTPPDDATPQENIVLNVAANEEIWLDERRIDIRSVRANVERIHSENPKAKLIIQSHPQVRNETLVTISDQAREADVTDISLVITRDQPH